jgi:hypothetical protein
LESRLVNIPRGIRTADCLGQPPIDEERFAVLAEHDVAGLQIAVQYAAAMSVSDGVAHVDKAAEELAQGQATFTGVAGGRFGFVETADGFLEVVTVDEAHGVEGAAVGVLAQAVEQRSTARRIVVIRDGKSFGRRRGR